MNANEILFRPSSLGDIMTGVAKNWSVEDSLTCKRKLIKIHREIKYHRYYNYSNKYTEKGIKMEQDAITLYSRVKKIKFKKNTERIVNDYFTGEPDIRTKGETIDVKCSWSLDTFPHALTDKPDKAYEYQGHGYMSLDNADKHTIVYCLVNSPLNLLIREKEKIYYNMDQPDEQNEAYKLAKMEVERNMIFDIDQFKRDNPNYDLDTEDWIYDIPLEERIVEFTVLRDNKEMEKIYNRVKACREWMQNNLFKPEPASVLVTLYDEIKVS